MHMFKDPRDDMNKCFDEDSENTNSRIKTIQEIRI